MIRLQTFSIALFITISILETRLYLSFQYTFVIYLCSFGYRTFQTVIMDISDKP